MRLNELYAAYKNDVHFYLVYIREAHPSDGWQVPNNLIEDIIVPEHTSDDARTHVASACQIALDIHMPMLVDSLDNSVEEKYIGLPMRLFLIDGDGRIAYAGDKGPFGWDDAGFEEAIKEQIG